MRLWSKLRQYQLSDILRLFDYQLMGIKAIKSIETTPIPSAVFDISNMIKVKTEPVTNHYKFIKKIGAGTYGEVFKATHQQTGNLRAIKKINALKFPRAKTMTLNEMTLLKAMDHPSILKIYEVYEEAEFIYIITEYCEGKELFDVIVDRHYLPEEEACYVFYEIASAVRCMHANRIMHRDLKPENIIYDEKKKNLKIIDFGSGVRFDSNDIKPRKRVGTSYYIAPEVLCRTYNEKCDIWSLGAILYVLLVGQPPFPGADDFKVMESIARGDPLKFRSNLWKKVSQKAKDLIQRLLNRTIQQRPSAAQLMEDPWFKDKLLNRKLDKNQERNIAYYLRNMQAYKDIQATALQEGMLIFIVNFVKDKNDEAEMANAFKSLDINRDGVISLDELQRGLGKYMKLDEAKSLTLAKQIFKKVDMNNSGAIDFSEFMMCAANIELTVSEENLDIAFDYIDQDSSGKLSVQEIREKLGTNITEETYNNLLLQFDVNNDGEISREEFKIMMKALVRKNKQSTQKLF